MRNLIFVLVAILSLLSVSNTLYAQNELYPQVWFNEKDASSKLLEGQATITGTAFTKEISYIKSQKHKAQENTKVLLFPMTAYLEETMKLQKVLSDVGGKVILSEKAFSYRLEGLTDANGNFTFYKMKPGKYYLQCNVEFVGHDVAQKEVGRTDYYNGYGYAGSSSIYEAYNYTYNGNHLLVKIVEIKEHGEIIVADLKPSIEWFRSYKILGAKLSGGDRCGKMDGKYFGRCTEFYDDGQPRIIAKWKDNAQEGTTLEFYETGELQIKSNWKNGQLNGEAIYYNKDRSVIKTETYVNHILVSTTSN
ncbi:toxin-antitoxin system YwqK family antitoxin [Maribacter sp. IgM3_T14_3]|uniref:toxin-antitoxin system YwqK family antitoxin n=1 Tax=Maribacter sp. IgM3_T14_3 TaxID=3415140 RepID=UPI003C702F53